VRAETDIEYIKYAAMKRNNLMCLETRKYKAKTD
jgi:hypothetical protein